MQSPLPHGDYAPFNEGKQVWEWEAGPRSHELRWDLRRNRYSVLPVNARNPGEVREPGGSLPCEMRVPVGGLNDRKSSNGTHVTLVGTGAEPGRSRCWGNRLAGSVGPGSLAHVVRLLHGQGGICTQLPRLSCTCSWIPRAPGPALPLPTPGPCVWSLRTTSRCVRATGTAQVIVVLAKRP